MLKFPVLVAAVVVSAAPAVGAEPPLAAISFADQYNRKQDLSQFNGDVVVVLYGNRDATTGNNKLGEKIHVFYHPTAKGMTPAQAQRAPVIRVPDSKDGMRSPEVRVVPVECVGKVPDLIKNYTRLRIRKEVPDSMVLIDFDNSMKERFTLKEGETNMLVVDSTGHIRLKVNGELDPPTFNRVIHTIDFLRKEAAERR